MLGWLIILVNLFKSCRMDDIKFLRQKIMHLKCKLFKLFMQKNIVLIFVGLFIHNFALAGAQKEENLSFSITSALQQSFEMRDPVDISLLPEHHKQKFSIWFGKVEPKLHKRITQQLTRKELLESIYYESIRASLDPNMVLGLIQVESGFRQYAMSPVGARGLMQVMPFWTKYLGARIKTTLQDTTSSNQLFKIKVNLRYGCTILQQYINMENGNLFLALGRYNGSRGQSKYPDAVFAAWRYWQTIAQS